MAAVAAFPFIKEPKIVGNDKEEEGEEAAGSPLSSERKFQMENKKQKILQQMRVMLDITVMKNLNFILWCFVSIPYLYFLIIVNTFIPSSATSIGLSAEQGALGSTLLSAMGAIGAVTNGMLADKIGNLNSFILCMTIASLTSFVIWTLAHNLAMFLLFVILHGLVYQCLFSVGTSTLIMIVGIRDYPPALGYRTLASAVSVLGPFVAIYLDSININMEPYFYCKIFAGSGYGLCALLALVIKFRITPRLFAII